MSGPPQNPYIGLRPYKESERDFFFGRDADRKIFVDMLLANRLTLLFAASGVGKSSLLQAAVMPHLKDPERENLDAVYCNNWAGNPLKSIRDAALDALTKSGRLSDEALAEDSNDQVLSTLFSACCAFTRQPLVIVLDQFEEFFRYHLGHPEFPIYKRQLVELITDRAIPVSIVLSMREDFALQLNAFKPEIPTVLFNNFYRLERLPLAEAELAIIRPASLAGWSYEPELLETLLKDLSARERCGRLDMPVLKAGLHVEPPYLQIICTQLFALEQDNPEHQLRLKTYLEEGSAVGLLKKYIDRITAELSYPERKLASKCFSHLITRRGTKVARTAQDLSIELRAPRDRLAEVLKRLESARLLRSQSDGEETYYELYHDLFSESVEQWNERFKAQERLKKTVLSVGAFLFAAVALYLAIDVYLNLTSYHLRLSIKDGPSGHVELYRGSTSTLDPFRLQRYVAETGIIAQQIEADQRFTEKPIHKLPRLVNEWAERLPAMERLRYYREHGQMDDAMHVARGMLESQDIERLKGAVGVLSQLGTQQSFDEIYKAQNRVDPRLLARALFSGVDTDGDLKTDSMSLKHNQATERFLIECLKAPKNPRRAEAAALLGAWRTVRAAPALVELLQTGTDSERKAGAIALVNLDSSEALKSLVAALSMQPEEKREPIIEAVVEHEKADSKTWKDMLSAGPPALRAEFLKSLIKNGKTIEALESYLDDPDEDVVVAAAGALIFPSEVSVQQKIRQRIERSQKQEHRASLAAALAKIAPSQKERLRNYEGIFRNFAREAERRDYRYGSRLGAEHVCSRLENIWPSFSLLALQHLLTELNGDARRLLVGCVPARFLRGAEGTLHSLFTSSDSELSATAMARLIQVNPTQAILAVRSVLASGSQFHRMVAVHGLWQLRTPIACELLSTLAAERTQPSAVRLSALNALDIIGGTGASQVTKQVVTARLRDLLRDSSALELRIKAAEALVAWIGEAAIADLYPFLIAPDAATRKAALTLLVGLRSPRTGAVLRAALGDEAEPDTATLAMFEEEDHPASPRMYTSRLKAFLLPSVGALSRAGRIDVAQMLTAMVKWGLPIEPTVITASLASTDRGIYHAALEAVIKLGDTRWRETLAAQLSIDDEAFRRTALDGFVRLVRHADLPALRESLRRFPQYLDRAAESSFDELENIDASLVFEMSTQPAILDGSAPTAGAKAVASLQKPFGQAWGLLAFSEVSIQHVVSAQLADNVSHASTVSDELLLKKLLDNLEKSASSIIYSNGEADSQIIAIARVLAERRVSQAVDPILRRVLFWSTHSHWAHVAARYLSSVHSIKPDLDASSLPKAFLEDRAYVPFLAALCYQPALHDMADPGYLTINQRSEAAALLAGQAWRCSEHVLSKLAKDPSVHVRVAVATAIGSIKAPWAISLLHGFLAEPNFRVKVAAAEALAKVAGVESLPAVRDAVLDRETPLLVIVSLLKALGNIGTPEAVAVLLRAAALYEDSIGRHAYRILGDIRATQVVPELLTRLRGYEAATKDWRAHRDRQVDDVRDKSTDAKQKGPQRPNGYTLFELITTLARLADIDTALPLLHHDLADVREAAAMGLALRGRVEVVEKLDALRAAAAASNEPLFRHAAFNCLDTTLEVIQKVGTAKELAGLKELRKRVKDRDGVLSRIDWTTEELEARVDGEKRAADAANP